MKRTRQVTLVLMGAVGLAGCGGEPTEEAFVFQNPQQCVAEKRGTDAECASAFLRAQGEHLDKAPRYEAKADCERDFGESRCQERQETSHRTGGGTTPGARSSSFVPFMAGYLMGRAGQTSPQPLYQFRGTGDLRTPGGATIPAAPGTNPSGPRSVPASALASAPRPVTVARGGFGATAMSVARSASA